MKKKIVTFLSLAICTAVALPSLSRADNMRGSAARGSGEHAATAPAKMPMSKSAPQAAFEASGAWARKSFISGGNSAAFLTLTNHTGKDDVLVSASSKVAKTTELHTHIMEKGVMQMRRVKGGIPVPKGTAVALAPGGYHIMLIGLKQKLAEGDTVSITLNFEHAPSLTLPFAIKKQAPTMQHHMPKGSDARGSHH